jgi:hypothetical protein
VTAASSFTVRKSSCLSSTRRSPKRVSRSSSLDED